MLKSATGMTPGTVTPPTRIYTLSLHDALPISGIAFAGGTLSGVTYDGTMDLSTANSSVYLTNGLTLAGINRTSTCPINSADMRAYDDNDFVNRLEKGNLHIAERKRLLDMDTYD